MHSELYRDAAEAARTALIDAVYGTLVAAVCNTTLDPDDAHTALRALGRHLLTTPRASVDDYFARRGVYAWPATGPQQEPKP
jgi:hypothetical protein